MNVLGFDYRSLRCRETVWLWPARVSNNALDVLSPFRSGKEAFSRCMEPLSSIENAMQIGVTQLPKVL